VSAVIVLRTESGEVVARLSVHERMASPQTSFLGDGRTLAVIAGDVLTLLSLTTGRVLASVKTDPAPLRGADEPPATRQSRTPPRQQSP
jgi:hypothetical protein